MFVVEVRFDCEKIRKKVEERMLKSILRFQRYSKSYNCYLSTIQAPPKPERKLTSLELQHLARKGFK